MLAESDTSAGMVVSPLCSAAVSFSGERAATITWLSIRANSSASASPIPDPAPVIKIVLPVMFIRGSQR